MTSKRNIEHTYGVPFYYLFPVYGYPKIDFWISNIREDFWISIIRFWDIQKSNLGYP